MKERAETSNGKGVVRGLDAAAASFRVVEWKRKAALLTQPKLPCLSPYHTLNLTAGCPNECRYCYAQSYAHHPGWGTVAFYANVLERFRDEFPRMRNKPVMVYFSTASEPFLPADRVLDDLYAIMGILLDAGVRLLISTKGIVQERFADLFARHPGKVHVQVGLTTVDDSVRAMMEPRASTVAQRLENLERLATRGVTAEARLDPLVPGLTDTDLSLDALFYELAKRGLRRAAASFLFLRWGIRPPWNLRHGAWTFKDMRKLYTHKVTDYCGGGTIWLPPTKYRRERFRDMRALAEGHGIRLHLCGCKNADLTRECCHPQPKAPSASAQQPSLFEAP